MPTTKQLVFASAEQEMTNACNQTICIYVATDAMQATKRSEQHDLEAASAKTAPKSQVEDEAQDNADYETCPKRSSLS